VTTEEIVSFYVGLLIIQYNQSESNKEFIRIMVRDYVMDQLPLQIQNAFDPATAVGVQLNTLGKYIGVSRSGYRTDGPITLNDSNYRILLQMGIIRNSNGSSLADIQAFLFEFFPDGEILVFDYANMRLSYLIDSDLGNQDLIQMLITQDLLPRPMGVQLASIVYKPDIKNFFGFRTYRAPGTYNRPFNTYADYNLDWPFLKYSDSFNPAVPVTALITTEDGDLLVQENGGSLEI